MTISDQRRLEYVPLDELIPAEHNPKRHDLPAIGRSIDRFGYVEPIVVDERTGRLVAGHGRLEQLAAAKAAGADAPDGVVATDRGWRVPVLRGWASRSDADAAAYLAASNRLVELGGWDDVELGTLLADVTAVDAELATIAGFDAAELSRLLAAAQGGPAAQTDPDEVPAAPAEPITRLGDVWLLGPHRLVCGDATDEVVLKTLMGDDEIGCLLTDPPYGINLDTDYSSMTSRLTKTLGEGTRGNRYRPIANDAEPFDAAPVRAAFTKTREQFWFGADYYRSSLGGDERDGAWLVWDKRNESSDNGFGSGFELIWSAEGHQRRVLRHYHFGAFGADARNRVHPTQKPAPLLVDILDRWAPDGCIVADPFAGSGSTLIACHTTGRTARLVELDPAYCDVICHRYQAHTGVVPVREATGEPHDFTVA